ncbi:hypothetical protein [Delftia tsuruhatensis]|uniref:hypothetical protein n=1 Tax=Delftia tsuruhatensis TaxID=180282 RepID=UPI0031D439A4
MTRIAALSVVALLTACASPHKPTPEQLLARDGAIASLGGCLRTESDQLDDQVSSAEVVAKVVLSACRRESVAAREASATLVSNDPEFIKEFGAQPATKMEMDTATGIVLRQRAARRR